MTTEEKWSERIDAWRKSGMTAPAFCEGKGFEASTLRYWASRLRKRPERAKATEVRLARVVRPVGEARSTSPIVVELGGARLTVGAGFDRSTLSAVIDVLAERGGAR